MNSGWKGLPIVIFGIGGFGKEVKLLVEDINNAMPIHIFNFLGFVSNDKKDIGKIIDGAKVVTCNDEFLQYAKSFNELGVSIALGEPKYKEQIEKNILDKCGNLLYPNLIHPNANISRSSVNNLGMGNIICNGVTFTTNIKLGKFVIVNINSTVGHNVVVGDYCTINPLVAISGDVTIKRGALIGAGASIKQKIVIGENSIVGLGAIVVKDVEDDSVVICKAAEKLRGIQK